MHPPFRWQLRYAAVFADEMARAGEATGVALAVENMFPISRGRLRTVPYSPGFDPTVVGHPHYTLDLSHTAAAGSDAVAMLERMGDRLAHVHLTDGSGRPRDEHLVPGRGRQPCAQICERLADTGYGGAVVIEVSTRRCRTRAERTEALHESLLFAQLNLQPSGGRHVATRSPTRRVTPALGAGSCDRAPPTRADGSPPGSARDWAMIGPTAHGGLLMALLARAGLARLEVAAPGSAPDPLVVAADFLRAPDPGPVELRTESLRLGRTASVVAVRLFQDGRTMMTSTVTAGRLPADEPVWSTLPQLAAEPPPDATDPGAFDEVFGVARSCDLRWDRAATAFARGVQAPPVVRGWVRPRGEPTDVLFALLAGDILPPTVFNLGGERGWAPTVQLTALLRARPAPGWLRMESRRDDRRRRLVRRGRRGAGRGRTADLPGPAIWPSCPLGYRHLHDEDRGARRGQDR